MLVFAVSLAIVSLSVAQNESLNFMPVEFPARVANVGGNCPSEVEKAEVRARIMTEAFNSLIGSVKLPASSCSAIPDTNPDGYYWILPATGPPAVQVYCDFNRRCGCDGPSAWTRVAFLNMSDPSQECPMGLNLITSEAPFRLCGIGRGVRGEECLSVIYSTAGLNYSRVCGQMLGYTQGSTEALHSLVLRGRGLEMNYLDGLSLTHGQPGAREHIWSFISANGETGLSQQWICECSNSGTWPYSTSFIEDNYFCDTGNHEEFFTNNFYPDDPLWDGAGCGPDSTCCRFNNPPWFCRTLPQPTTDDLEVRLCRGESDPNSDSPIQLLELYVQ